MYKNKEVLFSLSLLVFAAFIAAGDAFGREQPGSQSVWGEENRFSLEKVRLEEPGLLTEPWVYNDAVTRSLLYAQANTDEDQAQEGTSADEPLSPECAKFAADRNADVGEILRAGCKPTTAQMSALMDNPLGNVAMLFTQFDFTIMENPSNDTTENKVNYMGIAQFPKGLGKKWNLINRVIWNVPSMPIDQTKIDEAVDRAQRQYGSGEGQIVLPPAGSPIAPVDLFEGRTTGFGDMYYVGLVAPKETIKTEIGGNFTWGVGLSTGFPTASEDILGAGKWTAGPSGLAVYMGPKWKVGGLVTNYFDYAGDSDRDDVALTNLQYFVFYSLDEVTAIGASPNIIANWEQNSSNTWTVPIGLGIVRTFQFGKVPVRFGLEAHYSIVQPDDVAGAEWNFRFYVIPAAPSALFKWMQ
jgi:hypothetical protein